MRLESHFLGRASLTHSEAGLIRSERLAFAWSGLARLQHSTFKCPDVLLSSGLDFMSPCCLVGVAASLI